MLAKPGIHTRKRSKDRHRCHMGIGHKKYLLLHALCDNVAQIMFIGTSHLLDMPMAFPLKRTKLHERDENRICPRDIVADVKPRKVLKPGNGIPALISLFPTANQTLHMICQQGHQNLLFIREVIIKRPDIHAHAFRDLPHRNGGITVLREKRQSHVEDFLRGARAT